MTEVSQSFRHVRMLLIDNYDSFTYNLVQYMLEQGAEVWVARNDEIDLAAIRIRAPSHLVLSPGPGLPEGAGITLSLIHISEPTRLQ